MTVFLFSACMVLGALLVMVVLVQRGRGRGLAEAFGAGAPGSAMGMKGGRVFALATIGLFAALLALVVALDLWIK